MSDIVHKKCKGVMSGDNNGQSLASHLVSSYEADPSEHLENVVGPNKFIKAIVNK